MVFMTDKDRDRQAKIKASHSQREAVINSDKLISKAKALFEKGQMIDERDLEVTRTHFKQILFALKSRTDIDILTIYRGRETIGWILADEIL